MIAGCGGSGISTSGAGTRSTQEPAKLSPPPVPRTSIYLGAAVNPAGKGSSTPAEAELSELSSFESQVGGKPAILHVYASLAPSAPISALEEISSEGAVPLLDLHCSPLTQVLSGSLDGTFTRWAQELRQYKKPVFLRWFWEMNLPDKSSEACLGKAGPSEFVEAWRHIWGIFQRVGTHNVSFVWSPGVTAKAKAMGPFFPGATYVDWISVDAYLYPYVVSKHGVGTVEKLISPWYTEWAAIASIPLMISEIGAPQGYQADLFKLLSKLLPSKFPRIRGLVYFDAPGSGVQWALDAQGSKGFGALLSNRYFSFHLTQ